LQLRTISVAASLFLIGCSPSRAAHLTCGSCHKDEAKTQPDTAMAHAMERPEANPVLKANPRLEYRLGQFHYTVQQRGTGASYSVTDGTNTESVPLKWPFGQNSQTYVFEREGQLYESLVTFHPDLHGLDITTGDQSIRPRTLEEALGRQLTTTEATSCFGCHSTGSRVERKLKLDSVTPGVSCQRCHVNADLHLDAISHGGLAIIPPRLKGLSAEDISTFCGQCHRTWQTVVRNRWLGVMNVRFQPYRLANSKCFDGVDSRISCVACHDPHRDLVRDDASYDVNCHMPKVNLLGAHRMFTDHDIRIAAPNAPYPD
jgi:hypothetical protein